MRIKRNNLSTFIFSSYAVRCSMVAFVLGLISSISPIASAAQLADRSIELSNSSISSTNVTYKVTFTPEGDGAVAMVIDFCGNSPLVGQVCEPPKGSGFSAAGAATATPNFSVDSANTARVVIAGNFTTSPTTIDINGINNPSVAGPLYARIVTFDDLAQAVASTPDNLGSSMIDSGGVAILITDTTGVSGTVRESLTFCVSEVSIPDNCVTTQPPDVELGQKIGDETILVPGQLSEDSIFAQLSTNASSGAVVRLKSTAVNCGGLILQSSPKECHILPALSGGIDAQSGDAKFGVRTSQATSTPGMEDAANGVLQAAAGSLYNNDAYAMNFVGGNDSGVTSLFGDAFLDTNDAPANAKNMEIKFGATINQETPAGEYSTTLNLIAAGKF